MNSFYTFYLRWALLLPIGLQASALQAAPNIADLKKISDAIHLTQTNISNSEKKHNALSADLAKAETTLSETQNKKHIIQASIKQQQLELNQLQQQEKSLTQLQQQQEQLISAQLNASYRLGHEKNIKMLLNQDDSHAVSRSMTYSDYLTKSRVTMLNNYQQTLNDIKDTRTTINEKMAHLKINQDQLAEKESAIKTSYEQRQTILKQLASSIDSDKHKITQLQRNQEQLQQLLQQLRIKQEQAQKAAQLAQQQLAQQQQAKRANEQTQKNASQAIKILPVNNNLGFAKNKGKLPWPTSGKLINRFGERRPPGEFRWQGITFIAPQGNQVHSIFAGKVVFAEWFRGRGLLVIIDHGSGYMTLYAHNETLLKKAGDSVNAGENIATVGDSGGLSSPELYFELRLQGEPLNPSQWLRPNNS